MVVVGSFGTRLWLMLRINESCVWFFLGILVALDRSLGLLLLSNSVGSNLAIVIMH